MKSGAVGENAISTKGVARSFKRTAGVIGLDSSRSFISGTSCRVGAAQDFYRQTNNIVDLQIDGHWSRLDVPFRYIKRTFLIGS